MSVQEIKGRLLVELATRYELHPEEFLILSKQTVDSSHARLAVAELRNEGLVEEQVRGTIRLTRLGYKKFKNSHLAFAS